MERYKLIALVGKSGSGKDTILKKVCKNKNIKQKISYTSRPKRDYEVDGEDYFFVDKGYFLNNIYDFFEIDDFNGWYYGTKYEDLSKEKVNIGIFTPKGIEEILESRNIACVVIYLDVNDKERFLRILNREKDPDIKEIYRRFRADNRDFLDIHCVTTYTFDNNNKKDLRRNIKDIKEIIKMLENMEE